jgi:ubiquinone/menaquinone biosynthesis C-methylase UbiE
MTNAFEWTGAVGLSWSEEWQRTDRSFTELTQRLLSRIAVLPGEHVLDIGCGAGELSLAIAAARPTSHVLGVDISADLISASQHRSQAAANVRFEVADVSGWSDPAFVPDLLVSRHGVMFFADPVAAFAHLRKVSAPGASLVFSCFGPFADNAWASEMAATIAPSEAAAFTDPHAPGPFAFADPQRVRSILESAGWTDVSCQPEYFTYIAGEGDDPVTDALAFFRRIGPAAPRLRALPEAERSGAESALRALLERRRVGNRVCFEAMAWIVSARAPGG